MSEIEFELEVERIAGSVPAARAAMRKVERDCASAGVSLWKPAKSVPVRRGMSVAQGFETVVTSCLHDFRQNEALVVESRNAQALHQTRVAMRRLRSALALFRPVISGDHFERIRRELGWLSAELGDARNLDVYLERDLDEDQRQFLEARREKAYELAIAALKSARFVRLMIELADWSAAGTWHSGSRAGARLRPFVDHRIERLWSKIAECDQVRDLTDHRRHRLRIETKKLRYALSFFDALHLRKPLRKKRFMKQIKRLQKSLGQLHDEMVAGTIATAAPWLEAPRRSPVNPRRLARDADRAIRRLRKVGPYWS